MNHHWQKPRGTLDLFGDQWHDYDHLMRLMNQIASNFGYQQVVVPTFEHKQVFVRSLGDSSDVVNKEFFELVSRNEQHHFVLRPEFTASVMRLVANHKLLSTNPLPLNLFYCGPTFRYERPQAGRLREFYQFGIEKIGIHHTNDIVEIIWLAHTILARLKLLPYIQLKINYIGDYATKARWNQGLKEYFAPYQALLNPTNQQRLLKNAIRILDDKNDADLECVQHAPCVNQFWDDHQQTEFDQITTLLRQLNIQFEHDPKLVRGFDYYVGLVFEFVYVGPNASAQSTVIGGGLYQNILPEFGVNDVLAGGFGLGLQRLLLILRAHRIKLTSGPKPSVYVANLVKDGAVGVGLWQLIHQLRQSGIRVITNWKTTKLNKHFHQASRIGAQFLLIFGSNDLNKQTVVLKHLATQTQHQFYCSDVAKIVQMVNNPIQESESCYA